MKSEKIYESVEHFQLRESISRRYAVDRDAIVTFEDFDIFLPEFLKTFQTAKSRFIVASPALPSIAIAADKAAIELTGVESNQPFAGDIENLEREIRSDCDLIYLANPNRLSGSTLSTAQIRRIARRVENGMVIIDEYYHYFSNLSAVSLLNEFKNIAIIRSLEDWSSGRKSNSGFAFLSNDTANKFEDSNIERSHSRESARLSREILENEKETQLQVESIQKSALSIARELAVLGIKCQLTPANFVLMNSEHSEEIKRELSLKDIRIEFFENHKPLKNYLRYEFTGTEKDKDLITVLRGISANKPKIRNTFRSRMQKQADEIKPLHG